MNKLMKTGSMSLKSLDLIIFSGLVLLFVFWMASCAVHKPCTIPEAMPQPDPRAKPELGELIKPKAIYEDGDKRYPKEAYRGLTRQDIEKIVLMQEAWNRYQMDVETYLETMKRINQ